MCICRHEGQEFRVNSNSLFFFTRKRCILFCSIEIKYKRCSHGTTCIRGRSSEEQYYHRKGHLRCGSPESYGVLETSCHVLDGVFYLET